MGEILGIFIDSDRTGALAVNGLSGNGFLDLFFIVFSYLGNALFAFALAAPFLVKSQRNATIRAFTVLAVALAFGGVVNSTIKHCIPRDRPAADAVIGAKIHDLSGGLRKHSFPSGHTQTAFGAASVLAAETGTAIGVSAFLVAAAVGFSRIYLGAHFPLDVGVGAIVGLASSMFVIYIARKLKPFRRETHGDR